MPDGGGSNSSTSLRPLGNRVLLRKIEETVRGGIRRPEGSEVQENVTQEYELIEGPIELDGGARVYLARHKGWRIERNGEDDLYVADVEDILAVEESA